MGSIIWPVIFIVLAASCDAGMDILQFHFDNSIFTRFNPKFWNPSLSWTNKWGPKSGERFWGSTTIFVWLTDGWHLLKWFRNTFIVLSIIPYPSHMAWWFVIVLVIVGKILWGLTFQLMFGKVLKK